MDIPPYNNCFLKNCALAFSWSVISIKDSNEPIGSISQSQMMTGAPSVVQETRGATSHLREGFAIEVKLGRVPWHPGFVFLLFFRYISISIYVYIRTHTYTYICIYLWHALEAVHPEILLALSFFVGLI